MQWTGFSRLGLVPNRIDYLTSFKFIFVHIFFSSASVSICHRRLPFEIGRVINVFVGEAWLATRRSAPASFSELRARHSSFLRGLHNRSVAELFAETAAFWTRWPVIPFRNHAVWRLIIGDDVVGDFDIIFGVRSSRIVVNSTTAWFSWWRSSVTMVVVTVNSKVLFLIHE